MNRTIAEFVSHLKTLDVQLFVEGDIDASLDKIKLRCNAPEGILTTELRQELVDRKTELILYLQQENRKSENREVDRLFPATFSSPNLPISLSFAQQRLWFLYQLAPDNPFYNIPAAIRLIGKLDRKALERSFQEIVRRHAALRTTFTTIDGQPVQIVAPEIKVNLSVVNLQNVAESDRQKISQQLATAEAQRPFNLTSDRLLRITLLQFAQTEAILLLTLHHIVADGWSLGVLIRELGYFYTAFVEGRTPELPALPIQYTDFACWQRNWLQGKVLEEQLIYWRKQLQDLPVLNLPSDRPRPAIQTYRGATYPLQISPNLTQELVTLSQQSGASLFMTLLAAFQTLLYRYTGQGDIAIGSPIANRHRSELEGLIGFFVNSLVMRASNLSDNPTFRELLTQVRNVALEAYNHQDLPFEKLVEELDPDRDLSRNPLFQVAFALQNAPIQPLKLPGLMLQPAPLESGSTRFDLEIHLWESTQGLQSLWQSQAGLSGFISYSTDLFERDRIERLVGHFYTLLAGIVANPDSRISDLPLLTIAEYQQIFVEWNRSPLALNKGGIYSEIPLNKGDLGGSMCCFHQIFESQVQSNPKTIAIVSEQKSLTYEELNQKADCLAQILRQMGVQANSLVGLCVDRSADMVIGILGILKAGGAFVPLDPNYPSDRLHFMLADTQVSILLTQSWLVESLPKSSAKILCLDLLNSNTPLSKGGRGGLTITADNLAYVIYTSGSTGTPKGVLLSHRGLCNVVKAQKNAFHLSNKSRILQFSSISFDASIFEIALALGSGNTLYIPPKSAQLPGIELVQFMKDNAITHALLTPAVLAVLPSAELPDLQILITGGEVCSSQVLDRWAKNRRFFNAYGPTETTIWATVAELSPGDNPLAIGRSILNTQVYILDANLNPVPVGIPGELYIGGEGVAQGYLNRPDLTVERFIDVDFNSKFCKGGFSKQPLHTTENLWAKPAPTNAKLYKTGDRAWYLPDGTIEFLGRIDNQIKIRGFRVELGEIETKLQSHPAIKEAVVLASGETSNEKRLIAYFTLNFSDLILRDRQNSPPILSSLQTQQIEQWQTLYNQTYQPTNITENFNITGWNSSYTGEPIPLEQMQEWVSDRVQQILALKPKRVLEIGCGTGLLLFQIAPHCKKYMATDFSKVALESIQNKLNNLNLPQVELIQAMANDFSKIEGDYDIVILNSIVQYFPNVDYLMEVIEGSIQVLAPGGVLFIGDVRSLPLLKAFHSWMQFSQADSGIERTELQQRVDRSLFEEPELAIDPKFFYALRDRFPQIQQVQIRLSQGRHHNEMKQFRYNVLLHIKGEFTNSNQLISSSSNLIQKYNWKVNPIAVEEIKNNLLETKPELFMITNVTNSRVNSAIKITNWLDKKEFPKTVGRMRELLQDIGEIAIDPQDWWDLEKELPYNLEITWSTETQTGNYDVLLIKDDIDVIVDFTNSLDRSDNYTNNPLQSQFSRQIIPELRHYLKQSLPDYMIPFAFVPLETLPLSTNGKVDRTSLPKLSENSIERSSIVTSLTPTEAILSDIWKELLRLNNVNIQDNFFELGGHSLLATQMTSRVRDVFGVELPLKSLFEAPTIAKLAPIIENLRDTNLTTKIPPLVRLDRSAYRRKRVSSNLIQETSLSISIPARFELLKNRRDAENAEKTTQRNNSDANEFDINNSDKFIKEVRSPLVPLTLGGSKQPFFCVHPMFGVVFPYLELAHHLKCDRSLYGLQPLGLDGTSAPLNTIEAIAAYYIQAIQILQPQGPYFLGGWSFGGLVAFEMAQQLTQTGQEIGLLAILDTPAPGNKPSICQSLKFLLGTAIWSTLPFLLDFGAIATNKIQSQNSWFSRWQWSAIARLIPEESRLQLLDESAISPMLKIVYANAQAAYRYKPQTYSKRITLFKVAEQSDANKQNYSLGWSELANDIQVHQIPGNHLSLLKQPHVQILAEKLEQYLS
ncbi:non-ribosomal peptide synthetase [[Phormidium ambiguum] IAM M-71]|uniref:Non-ribosomal peptide synthetase n=1 Tax=[Phormidium ambiguum] IAM M-71 TaxID=454136 RepID=A0A1U7IKP7_9CYAN|nr:non-ribosomal peptide synthetase [Phormidium ambiguum]OKH37811.1 non-ribosomal peptide synthetase [Phormidium ambiguum IAM M-71]